MRNSQAFDTHGEKNTRAKNLYKFSSFKIKQ